ncbi:peptidase M22 [Ruminococcus sp. Marseille-P6503]|uniref:peptidase M22 n=1 Tax=Ruminococcus sp. Marseille-P6503 TaxID=2364796 RepID=UPI000F52A798|nr:peptidase M22 [Ruminococcus sp. Marseille-P6503]
MSKILGIDTSNYTTSAALLDTDSMEVVQSKLPLPVKRGEKGIRQSDALFHHTRQLPRVLKEVLTGNDDKLSGIGVSDKPRSLDGSYMPCFLAGQSAAEEMGLALGLVPDLTSHQTGHILAALYSCKMLGLLKADSPFIAFHVSGGTTDMLLCTPDKDAVLNIETIGCSLDLNAGQAIDRTGVMLGLDFPCGIELEKLALKSEASYRIKPSMKEMNCCLSGVENQCRDMYESGGSKENVARFCIFSILAAVTEMTKLARRKYGDLPFIYAGGVMSNKLIAENLESGYFAEPEFSRDNAVGTAIYSAVKRGMI